MQEGVLCTGREAQLHRNRHMTKNYTIMLMVELFPLGKSKGSRSTLRAALCRASAAGIRVAIRAGRRAVHAPGDVSALQLGTGLRVSQRGGAEAGQ